MNTKHIFISLFAFVFITITNPAFGQDYAPVVSAYQDAIIAQEYEKAAAHLLPALDQSAWIKGTQGRNSEDLTITTVGFKPQADPVSYTAEENNYHLISLVELQRYEFTEHIPTEALVAIMDDYRQLGEIAQQDERSFELYRPHRFIAVGNGSDWKIIGAPNGHLDVAYPVLPTNAWINLLGDEGLSPTLPYQQAIELEAAKHTRQLNARELVNIDATATWEALRQLDSLGLQWTVTKQQLLNIGSQITEDGKQYVGFGQQLVWHFTYKEETSSEEDMMAVWENALSTVFPYARSSSYDAEAKAFTLTQNYIGVATALEGSNKWQLYLQDKPNGRNFASLPKAVINRALN